MAATKERRVLSCILLLQVYGLVCSDAYTIPTVTFEIFSPRGFKASIPDDKGITFFAFNANVNRPIDSNLVGSIKGEILKATNERWEFVDTETELKFDDVINYYVFVSVNRVGYQTESLSYTVRAYLPKTAAVRRRYGGNGTSNTGTSPTNCFPTLTQVQGGRACGGQAIFEDDFTYLRKDLWQIEHYLPVSSHPEYPFVSYQRLPSDPVVSVSDGYLRITPKIQQNIPGFTNESISLGSLDLFSGCTFRAEECYRQASGPDILPPVVSGRLTSAGFAFKYGIVKVRAKLPQGDWLYPEILLEPFYKKYGSSNYASGILKIAITRGNRELRVGTEEFGNNVLYGGPILDVQCRAQLMFRQTLNGGQWGDEFHEYSVTWTPQYIALSVDGEEWARVHATGGLYSRFPQTCSHLPRMLLEKGAKIAPFDDYFFITLGVAAGGITEFPDDSYSSQGAPKPWHNSARKGMLNFWEDLSSWHATWTQPEMLVDYVKVIAL